MSIAVMLPLAMAEPQHETIGRLAAVRLEFVGIGRLAGNLQRAVDTGAGGADDLAFDRSGWVRMVCQKACLTPQF